MKKIKRSEVKNPWFKLNRGYLVNGRIPIRWQGYLTIILFLTLNFYSVFYFKFPFGGLENVAGFFAVLLLSTFVFLVIAKKKTRGEKIDF